jgi:2-oxo-4-hydroxy-4-carboxy-5-ureidoimidazoline decarboxylase
MNASLAAATPLLLWQELAPAEAAQELLACCGCTRWASTLVAQRPFEDSPHLLHASANLWFLMDEADWLEAFACHPRIGERKTEANVGFLMHSSAEQAAARATLERVADALAEANRVYEDRFGFLYLISANGRTAPEMLAILEHRLTRDRGTELHEAARQQHLITDRRMRLWLELGGER